MDAIDPHTPLRDDVRLLGDLLGHTIKDQASRTIFSKVEKIRKLAKKAVQGDEQSLLDLHDILTNLSGEECVPITRAFSQFLNFANTAEQYHRIRRTRHYQMQPVSKVQPGSLAHAFELLNESGIKPETIIEQLRQIQIDLVLTAHPTEVKRRTILNKYTKISDCLAELDQRITTPTEKSRYIQSIACEMDAIWQTAEVRSARPTPIDEAKWGFAVIENNLWDAIPAYLKDLDDLAIKYTSEYFPMDICPIRIGSWMGGDRDGNPNVTAQVTQQVCYMARWVAADLFLNEVQQLRLELSMDECHGKLKELVGTKNLPYRIYLGELKQRLQATKSWAEACIEDREYEGEISPILEKEELLEYLMNCFDSLVLGQGDNIARGKLIDIIRRVYCFGLHLCKMDLRQEAGRHSQLMTEMTEILGLGQYSEWPEEKKLEFLKTEIANSRPLLPKNAELSGENQETYETFEQIAKLPRENLGHYVISMANSAADVLLVVLLQQEVGVKEMLPVVPLFETLDDLTHSSAILDELLSYSHYRNLVDAKQEVMIGYSDSSKDAGLLAASWAQYQAQEQMIGVAKNYDVELTFFHGRGGSVGRGGWPTNQAIRSLPPGTLNNKIRVTQQGEVIYNRFGLAAVAKRTLHVYTSATLEAILNPPVAPKQAWRAMMNDLARISAANYQETLQKPELIEYFEQATPVYEIGELAIGSRPATRNKSGGLESLRAIPWVFAWTQNRMLLPAWLGLAASLNYAKDIQRFDELIEMYQQWPFFKTMVEMFEMVLAKADPEISKFYDDRLLNKDLLKFGECLRNEFSVAKENVLNLLDQEELLTNNPVLDRSIKVRSTYLLPLHLMQVEMLKRTRAMQEDDFLQQALLISIAGIAAGMRNTG